jgi:putative holliday junction resolvase
VSRLLGIDLGERRIGLAVADSDGLAARALATIPRAGTIDADARRLREIVGRESIGELVVGLPLEARGNEGTQSGLTRAWADAVGTALGLPVVYRDERLTSHLAEQRVGPIGRGRSGGPPGRSRRDAYRARVDREAAAIILQDELDARAAARAHAAAQAGDETDATQPMSDSTEAR